MANQKQIRQNKLSNGAHQLVVVLLLHLFASAAYPLVGGALWQELSSAAGEEPAELGHSHVVVAGQSGGTGSGGQLASAHETGGPERITVIAPKHLRPHSDYHVLVSLAGSQAPATIDLQLTGARDSNREQNVAKSIYLERDETQTIKFSIGDWLAAEYILGVTAQAVDRSWNFSQEATLLFRAKTFSMLIQTDKPIYGASQLVQFRSLFLEPDLRPLSIKESINVTVYDPKRNVVKQWDNLSNYRGLLSLDFQLSQYPMLGDWTIQVAARGQESFKQFHVAEYVLPTFEVQLQLPPYATYNESQIVASVRASYTYGKPVSGHVTLTVQPLVRFSHLDTRPLQQSQHRLRLVKGEADIPIDIVKSLRLKRELFEREIEFFALVEEDFTGRKYNKTSSLMLHDKAIKVEQINKEQTFKPGMKYTFQLKVAYQDDTPVEDNGPELMLRISDGFGHTIETARLRPTSGLVDFTMEVPSKVNSALSQERQVPPTILELQVEYRGQLHYLSSVEAYSSKSLQFMQISLPELRSIRRAKARKSFNSSSVRGNELRSGASSAIPQVEIGEQLRVLVEASEPMQQVTCWGLARGDIAWALSKDVKNASQFEFSLQVEQGMGPEMRLLCFYVRPIDKEIIADSTQVRVGGLLRNSVRVVASRQEAKPGEEVELSVLTKANSLVGLLAVDQSVLLLRGSGNDISLADLEGEEGDEARGGDDEELHSHSSGSGATPPRGGGGGGGGELSGGRALNADALFELADVVVLTNGLVFDGLGLRSPLLYAGLLFKMAPVGVAAGSASAAELSRSGRIQFDGGLLEHELQPPEFHLSRTRRTGSELEALLRSNFAETWLWANATADGEGRAHFKSRLPDTISSWAVSAFSLSELYGLGVSGPRPLLRTFRPFFIKLNLPHSLIRGEMVAIQGVIFNYSKRPTRARVTLDNSRGEFEFVEPSEDELELETSRESSQSRTLSVAPDEGQAVSFLIRPLKLGHVEIRMQAQSDFAADLVSKKLLVKPEGQVQQFNTPLLVELGGDRKPQRLVRNVSLEVPANAVEGSLRVGVSAVGDLLGAGLANVDDLLRLPYGCGEQNMINLAPNVVLLNYLSSTRRLKEAQRARAKRNIEIGYQRQLTYKRRDGSFSAFGEHDSSGSTWLTSYVLRTLVAARQAGVAVDERILAEAAAFLSRQAQPDGSVRESGMIHHKELRAAAPATQAEERAGATPPRVGAPSSGHLTAYAMMALLQGGQLASVPNIEQVIGRGLDYVERELAAGGRAGEPSAAQLYGLALAAYVLQLAPGRQRAADEAYERLWRLARQDQDLTWWPTGSGGSPATPAWPAKPELGPDRPELEGEREGEEAPGEQFARLQEQQPPPPPPQQQPARPPPLKPLRVPADRKQSAHLYVPDAIAVEVAALSLLAATRRSDLERALPVARWLVSQQNSLGGFASTHDTVLAIEALAAFARAQATGAPSSSNSIHLEVAYPRPKTSKSSLRGSVAIEELLINDSNSLILQHLQLPANVSWVELRASGSGTAVVQVSWQYNLLVSAERPAFYLSPTLDKSSSKSYLQLSVCTYYKAGPSSNMALLEVELPSGYLADQEALGSLTRIKEVKRVDIEEGGSKVMVYLERVTRDEICLTIPAHRLNLIGNNKPVPVTIYDYYNRKEAARVFYVPRPSSACDICDQDQSCKDRCIRRRRKSDDGRASPSSPSSLHEQRRLSPAATSGQAGERGANLRLPTSGSSRATNNQTLAGGLLPLAPVLVTLMTLVRTLYE